MRADHEREYVEYVRARTPALRRTAYRLCGDWHRAEDLVQRVFVLLYRHWRRASAADSPDAYVRTMLVRTFLDEQRTWWARRVVTGSGAGGDDARADRTGTEAAHSGEAQADQRLDLLAALRRLTPGQRAVLVLRYFDHLDVAQTAQVLGVSAGTVKSQTSLAVAALRRLLPGYVSERLAQGRPRP